MNYLKKVLVCTLFITPLMAKAPSKEPHIERRQEFVSFSVEEYNALLMKAVETHEWKEVVKQALFTIKSFPETSFSQEAIYFLGKAYFELHEFDLASQELSNYLKKTTPLQHFRDAIELKFLIAEKFREGHLQRIGGVSFLPKWMGAREEAIQIYEEVISAFPHDELAARSLLGKGDLLLRQGSYSLSIEAYETVIRKFPKHPLVPEAYVEMLSVYLTRAQHEYPNVDHLDLAELQLKRFKQDFALDPRLEKAEEAFLKLQEVFAQNFYDLAQFYERMKKPGASILYYAKIIKTFPNTKTAALSKKRLKVLQPLDESSHDALQSSASNTSL
ncbi:tetratricopeptide repeat protein [Rhabdochlamydiaceae symbiont of Dictyostelium giganteum]|uniref:tetratricopeptide repeat protein n=1 Tax=Rhabdochlamydiaceae symbiont of Dictyostelium giganteum TaxID=3342349 RepID=UPI00384CE3A2